MSKSFFSRYRVDNIPFLVRPIFYLYGYGLGAVLFIILLILRITIKVEITGGDNLRQYSNHIFCHWHSFVPLALQSTAPNIPVSLDRCSYVFMQHPAWHMKPVHVLLRLMGVKKLILGSTGHSGREAADNLVEHLRQGFSTVLMPDGPHGRAFILKKGILHVSLQSQVPIVAMQFSSPKSFELKTWDRKRLAYPFSTIKMKICNPIQITGDNFDKAHTIIKRALG